MGLTGSDKQPKHVTIMAATSRVLYQVEILETLIDRIQDAPPRVSEGEESMKTPSGALSEFLSSEGTRIRDVADRIANATELLKGILF